jgi:hypothetical protein
VCVHVRAPACVRVCEKTGDCGGVSPRGSGAPATKGAGLLCAALSCLCVPCGWHERWVAAV